MADEADPHKAAFDRLEQMLEFPTDFPLKVMGRQVPAFEQTVLDIVHRHVPAYDASQVESRPSSQGNYLSLTMHLRIDSRQQLEDLHRELLDHPLVRLVL